MRAVVRRANVVCKQPKVPQECLVLHSMEFLSETAKQSLTLL